MESIKHTVFEDPTYLYVFLALVALAIGAVWYERRSRTLLACLAIPVALAGAAYLVARYVETDREQIIRLLNEMADDISAGSVDRVEDVLDDSFTGAYANKAAAVKAGREAIKTFKISKVLCLNPDVAVEGERATMHVTTMFDYVMDGQRGRASLVWDMRWVKRGDSWRLAWATRPEMGYMPFGKAPAVD